LENRCVKVNALWKSKRWPESGLVDGRIFAGRVPCKIKREEISLAIFYDEIIPIIHSFLLYKRGGAFIVPSPLFLSYTVSITRDSISLIYGNNFILSMFNKVNPWTSTIKTTVRYSSKSGRPYINGY